jgi:SAM-dependent methyltransferase
MSFENIQQQLSEILTPKILDENAFVRATFSGTQHGQSNPWLRLVIRPVLLKNRRHLQFSWFDAKQNFVKNYAGADAATALAEAFNFPFANFTVQTTAGDTQVQITKKGKLIVHEHKPRAGSADSTHDDNAGALDLAHDRAKNTLLTADAAAAPFLQAIGIMNRDGSIRAAMQSKFRQINEFLRLLDETGEFDTMAAALEDGQPLEVIDCGCGNAYLTFATYYYLNRVRGIPCRVTGVDTNHKLLEGHVAKVAALGWDGLNFEVTRIEDYVPLTPPHLVIALHACDTATDDALAQGIRWNSRMIVAVPCCHHHLQVQLDKAQTPDPFSEMLRYRIMHQHMGDLLTDSFRALLLRIAGYRVDVIQFVDFDHTPKNTMLRAVRTGKPNDPRLLNEYHALKDFWHVTPYLETLISS